MTTGAANSSCRHGQRTSSERPRSIAGNTNPQRRFLFLIPSMSCLFRRAPACKLNGGYPTSDIPPAMIVISGPTTTPLPTNGTNDGNGMKNFKSVLLCLLIVTLSQTAHGQFQLSLGCDPFGDVSVYLDSSAGGPVQGWSLAVCHDPSQLSLNSVGDGASTATVGSGGGPPAFDTITTFPDGWTVGVVIDFLGCCTLPPGPHELNVASYDISGVTAFGADVCFCSDTLGSPAVTIVVVESGASIPPDGIDSCCFVSPPLPPDPDWLYSGSNEIAPTSGGLSSATVSFSIESFFADPASDTQGFSMGWSASGGHGVTVSDPVAVNDLAALNGGTGPSFFGTSNFGSDWTVGVVYNFLGGVFIQYPSGSAPAVEAEYTFDSSHYDTITISVDNTLGSPPVSNVVVVGGASFAAEEGSPGTITPGGDSFGPFIRGDCNDDGVVNIADSVWTLNELFQSGPASVCPAACDSNDDGMVDATDATYTLNYRFLDGPPPPAPFPDCGGDGGFDCNSSCP